METEFLRGVKLFAELGGDELAGVAAVAEIKNFKTGEAVYTRGMVPQGLYIVRLGKVKAVIESEKAEEVVGRFGEGEFFGETSLITGRPHSVTARAEINTELLIIPREKFQQLLNRNLALSQRLLALQSLRLRSSHTAAETEARTQIISVCSAEPRAGKTLLAANLAYILSQKSKDRVLYVDMNPAHQNPFEKSGPLAGLDVIDGNSTGLGSVESWKKRYKYIIFDLAAFSCRFFDQILKLTNTLFVLTYDSRVSKKEAKKLIEYIKELEVHLNSAVRLGVNLYGQENKLKKFQFEREVGLKIDFTLSNEDLASVQNFVVKEEPHSPLTKDLENIAQQITKKKVGLALGAGAAQGLAHIGVLKVLERENIPIDILAGTSGGSLYGAGFASGFSARELEKIALTSGRGGFLAIADFKFPKSGFFKGDKVVRVIKKFIGDKKFADLKIPMLIVATDLMTGEEIVLKSGLLYEAIRCSISIPGIFIPVKYRERYLIDGSSSTPVPVEPLYKAGVDFIIGVSVSSYGTDEPKMRSKMPGIFNIIMRSREISGSRISELNCFNADVVIRPQTEVFGWMEYQRAPEIIAAGEAAAEETLPTIKKLLEI